MRARIRAGDPQAFAELFDEYARILYNHAFRLTADWAAAEDVVSATFMEAWRGRQRVDADGGSLRPWLLGIATNLVRAQSRSNRRFKAAALAAAQAETAVADHADEVAGRIDDRRAPGRHRHRSGRAAAHRARSAQPVPVAGPGLRHHRPGPGRPRRNGPLPPLTGPYQAAQTRGYGNASRFPGTPACGSTGKRRPQHRGPARPGRNPVNMNQSRLTPDEWQETARLVSLDEADFPRAATPSTGKN